MPKNDRSEMNNNPAAQTMMRLEPPTAGRDIWLYAWLGTALAGGGFGLLFGLTGITTVGIWPSIVGLVFGFLIAAIVAAPVVLTAATASWALGLRRVRPLLAIAVGGVTGILSTLPAALSDETAAQGLSALAGVAGAAGSGIAMAVWKKKYRLAPGADLNTRGPVELSALGRLYRLGVLAVVIAACAGICAAVFLTIEYNREAGRRTWCERNLRQIALGLQEYEMVNKSLPPAYLTDKAGKRLMSWRVAAAQSECYEVAEKPDFTKPWDDPKNDILHFRNPLFHCLSSSKEPRSALTDYVAVVGPDTLWPGKTPGDRKKHPKGILVVEWPKSNIHWAEPRDISVEEFLDWFRAKPPRRGLWDWLCARPAPGDGFHCGGLLYVDAEGNVGQLPRDTDPETVRKMLSGRSTAATACPTPSGR